MARWMWPLLRSHATRELSEETRLGAAPDDLELWLVTRGEYGNLGVFFLAAEQPLEVLCDRFTTLTSAEAARGREPADVDLQREASGQDPHRVHRAL
jgi:hypothetical protein